MVAGLLLVGMISGCKHPKKFPKGEETPDAAATEVPTPPLSGAPLSPAEVSAAVASCQQFVAAVCDCAAQKAESYKDACERAKGQVDAIKLHAAGLDAAFDAGVHPRVMFQSIREIARACGEDMAAFTCK